MPTEEERRREYRPGYNPRGNYTSPTPNLGIWDTVRSELNALSGGAPQGQSLIGDVVGGVRKMIPGAGTVNPQVETLKTREAIFGPQEPNYDTGRTRRLEQAGVASPQPATAAAPVMAQNAAQPGSTDREAETRRVYNQPQQASYGGVPNEPVPNESTRSSAGASTGPGLFRKGIGSPMQQPASDQQYVNAPPVTVDPRKRYYDMAGMSLEQRNAMLDAMPEGQRPIQTIRGNKEGWYNPALSKEFSGISEALTGVEGRPTYKSEQNREEEARDRSALTDQKRYASDMVYRAHVDSAAIHAASAEKTAKAGAKSQAAEPSWKTVMDEGTDAQGNIIKTPWLYNEKNPAQRFPLKAESADLWASEISKGFDNPQQRTSYMGAMKFMDRGTFLNVMGRLPGPAQEYYREMFREEAKKDDNKAKGK